MLKRIALEHDTDCANRNRGGAVAGGWMTGGAGYGHTTERHRHLIEYGKH